MMETPDKWLILKIKSKDDPHYRVFGVWHGGFLNGDSWKMNSGIVNVTEDKNFYFFHGSSGSIYKCHKSSYGTTSYGNSIINQYIKNDIAMIMDDINWINFDWIIN